MVIGVGCGWSVFWFVSVPVLFYSVKWLFFAWIIRLNNSISLAAVNRHLVFF